MASASRDWSLARAKVDSERGCRICGSRERVEAAHTIGRKYDSMPRANVFDDPKNPSVIIVDPVDIVPLCQKHHLEYDARRLDLLPHLTREEQASAVLHVGIVSALRRLTSGL